MTLAERFGRRLFMARRRLGVSQEALAKMCGLHRDTIFKIENGHRAVRLETLIKLADGLGIDPGELVAGLRP